jgi:hypothetical protein
MEPAVCNIESAKDILTIFYPLNQNWCSHLQPRGIDYPASML